MTYYLIRLEPFTALHRGLQGGRFDHADRLFHSVAATYRNCTQSSSDVKELIPEFYYQPEFLRNSNGLRLGTTQRGTALGDVALPPWARGSPEEFVRVMAAALESEHVSRHLHEWVDLVFGFKQQGRAAVEAVNIFHYLTYEGAVDLDAVEDAHERKALQDQVSWCFTLGTGDFGRTDPEPDLLPRPSRSCTSARPPRSSSASGTPLAARRPRSARRPRWRRPARRPPPRSSSCARGPRGSARRPWRRSS